MNVEICHGKDNISAIINVTNLRSVNTALQDAASQLSKNVDAESAHFPFHIQSNTGNARKMRCI